MGSGRATPVTTGHQRRQGMHGPADRYLETALVVAHGKEIITLPMCIEQTNNRLVARARCESHIQHGHPAVRFGTWIGAGSEQKRHRFRVLAYRSKV